MSRTPTQRPERTKTGAHAATHSNRTGARAVGGGPHAKRPPSWLWWLLGLLAVALIAALLIGALGGDDGENAQNPAVQGGQSKSTTAGGETEAGGALTAGATNLLPVPSSGLGDTVGEVARGRGVVVQSVVTGQENPDALEGFWVGSSEQDRVYVEWGGDVGADEADYLPEVEDKVKLTGPVHAAPQDPEQTLNLSPEDAQLVREQGAYVNADEVTPADG
jgi:hypothetical protein